MQHKFPEIKTIEKVTKKHAEKYIQFLTEKGKFIKTKTFKRKNKTSTFSPSSTLLSPRSVNAYLVSINEIFNLLASDGGYIKSPFSDIPKQKLIQDKREAFTLEELRLIAEDADDFILPLFTVGLCTGLREADICLLEWQDVDLSKRIISRITRKTGTEVKIPIMPPLATFLDKQLIDTKGSNYVLPEHADMYLKNPSGITWRVKKKLEQLEIKTTKIPEGRSRAVSIKDVHSLRHSFCYYAGLYNVPLAIVQSVVGHMSPEMTKHYTMHATTSDIKKAFENIPDIFGVLDSSPMVQQLPEATELEPERKELMEFVHSLPLDKIKDILSQIKT
jgi:integrase